MIIGVDIGGTKIKAGLIRKGEIPEKIIVNTPKTKKEIIDKILFVIDFLNSSKVSRIGIGCPGPSDYKKGIIGDTPNLPLKGTDLKKIIYDKFRKKVIIENDAGCFALGESKRLKMDNLAVLTIGSGVGGGMIIDGKQYKGKGNAGHFGHCTIRFDGAKSKFNQGALEDYISAKAIKRKYGKRPSELKSKKAWEDIGRSLGIGISNIINSFDPEIIVLGGGISRSFNLFKASMNKEIKKRSISKVKVIKGDENSGIIGAGMLE